MKTKKYYFALVVMATAMLSIPTACTNDTEDGAEDLARKYCDCEKIKDLDKQLRCFENVNYQVSLHLKDAVFMAAYTTAAQSCPK